MHHQHAKLAAGSPTTVDQRPDLKVTSATAALQQARLHFIAARNQGRFLRQDCSGRSLGIRHVAQLNLSNHQRRIGLADKAAALAYHSRGVAGCRYNRGLLDAHRHQVVAAIDLKI